MRFGHGVHGIQVDQPNDSGVTPLYIAVQHNHDDVSLMLLKAGADPNHATNSGSVPLRVAVFHCNLMIVRQLLENGATIDASVGSDGNSVAMLAAYNLDVDILCELLLFGASLNKRNEAGADIDYLLRTLHGVSIRQLAFYCIAQNGSDHLVSLRDHNEVCDTALLLPCGLFSSLSLHTSGDTADIFWTQSEDKKKIRELFDVIDRDADGRVTKLELTESLEEWGLSSK